MDNSMLTIALAKGRLGDKAVKILEKSGYSCDVLKTDSRQLILTDESQKLRFILSKPVDVPTYVSYGTADIGVVGKDTVLEAGLDLYEVLDLNYGQCRLAVCGPVTEQERWQHITNKRIATKYPNVTRQFFSETRQESVEIIKLNGSIELAPLVGLADLIVDIVESGRTLKENNLTVFETIAEISARMVVNRVSMKMKADRITPMISAIRTVLKAK